jgi:hypothetical protein
MPLPRHPLSPPRRRDVSTPARHVITWPTTPLCRADRPPAAPPTHHVRFPWCHHTSYLITNTPRRPLRTTTRPVPPPPRRASHAVNTNTPLTLGCHISPAAPPTHLQSICRPARRPASPAAASTPDQHARPFFGSFLVKEKYDFLRTYPIVHH